MNCSHTHTHTKLHNDFFAGNIEEVMALCAISLLSSAVEVHRQNFQSLITEQKLHGRRTDRHLSQRYMASDNIQHESAVVHTNQSLIQIMVDALQRGTPVRVKGTKKKSYKEEE